MSELTKEDFKRWRKRLGISQRQAAIVLVTSLSQVKKIEAGFRNASRRIEVLMWYNEKHVPPPAKIR